MKKQHLATICAMLAFLVFAFGINCVVAQPAYSPPPSDSKNGFFHDPLVFVAFVAFIVIIIALVVFLVRKKLKGSKKPQA